MKNIFRNTLIIFLLIAGGLFVILENQLWGFRAFIVSSGSMEPTISTGSTIITQYTHPNQLQKKDIITFIPPTKEREFVTHRIVTITKQPDVTTFTTKGDNNKNEDLWILAGGAIVGKVIYTIPYLGFFLSFIKSKVGIILFILLPAVYIIVDEITTIIKIIKNHKKNSQISNLSSSKSNS